MTALFTFHFKKQIEYRQLRKECIDKRLRIFISESIEKELEISLCPYIGNTDFLSLVYL